MTRLENAKLEPTDLVAVVEPPGPGWLQVIRELWDAGAALLPVDTRLPRGEIDALLARARPTVILGGDGWQRRRDGIATDPGVALVVHTSGTAGTPKLAQFDRASIEAAVDASASTLGAGRNEAWLCCLPPAHVGGLLVLMRGVVLGAPVVILPRFDPGAVAREQDLDYVAVVPTMLSRLSDARVDLSRFRAVLVGGAHLPRELRARAEGSGARIVETYGLTESCGGVVYEGLPLPGVEVRIDPAGGIELRGPTVMLGYRLDAAGTRGAFTADGWLRTGDAGSFDDRGRLTVLGRIDSLITSGGEKVWPEEVEAALAHHPKVADVAVAARPDPEWGERVVAHVVPSDPDDPPTLQDLRSFLSPRLAKHKAPRELVLVPRLPRTSSGKVRRPAMGGREGGGE